MPGNKKSPGWLLLRTDAGVRGLNDDDDEERGDVGRGPGQVPLPLVVWHPALDMPSLMLGTATARWPPNVAPGGCCLRP